MPTSSSQSPDTFFTGLKVLALAHLGALVVFGIVALFSLGEVGEYPSIALVAGLFGANVVAFAVAEIWGYRTEPAPTGDDEEAHLWGQEALRRTTFLRLVVTEAPAIIALVAAFVVGSWWVYLAGGFWALLSMAWHAYPSRRVLTRLEESLDREGGRSRLTDLLGDSPAPGYQQY